MKGKSKTKVFVWTKHLISAWTKGPRLTLQRPRLLTICLEALLISAVVGVGLRTVNAQTVIQAVDGGYLHSLALENNGRVWAWGLNFRGEVGDNTTTKRLIPVQVHGVDNVGVLTGVTALAAGGDHSLALKSDGTVLGWGDNGSGQLGDGTTTNRLTPIQIQSLTGIIAIAAGTSHSLALKSDGTVFAWGDNESGQLGDGATTRRLTPIQVQSLTGIIAIAAGTSYSLALKSDGTVFAWGLNSSNGGGAGQLGDGTTTTRLTPVQVHGVDNVGFLTGVTAISAGGGFSTIGQAHSLALKSDGTVFAWGWNRNGSLGDGTTTDRLTPVQVHGVDNVGFLSGVTTLSAGGINSVAAKSDGTVFSWGLNIDGQLGDGTKATRITPVQVHGVDNVDFLTGVTALAAGEAHSLALKNDGSVFVWGQDAGAGDLKTTPVQVQFRADITPPPTGPCVNPPPGLKGWWPLDETTGTTAADIIAGHNGTALPGPIGAIAGPGPVTSASWPPPPFPTGKVGTSLFFNENRRVEVPHNSALDPGTGDFTVDAWVFYPAVGNGRLLTIAQKHTGATAAFGNTLDGWDFVIRDSSPTQGRLSFRGSLSLGGSVEEPITPNTWHHVSATLSTTNGVRVVKNYVDGVSSGQVGLNSNIASTAPLLIGGDGIGGGSIAVDEVEIFNRGLTQQEIQSLFNAGSAGECKCTPPPSGLVSWWPGDGNANDIQDGNNGTFVNGATFAAGKVGQAFSFDGIDDFVQVADNTNLQPTRFTIDAWIKTATIPEPIKPAFILARAGPNGFNGYDLSVYYTSGVATLVVRLDQFTFGSASGNTNVADGNWHHVAGTYDGTTVNVYVDGVLQGATTYTAGVGYVSGDPLLIGKRQRVANTSNFNGLIDEVEIFNRALSASEILGIFNAGSAGKCKTVVNPNHPPVANAGQSVEATSPAGASVTLNGSGSSDPDGDPLTYNWTGPFGAVSGVSPTVTLTLGTHIVTLTVSDGHSTATDTIQITVQDTTPPDTIINSAADGNRAVVVSGGSTLSRSITFTFGGTDAVGVAGFQCSRDGAAYTPCSSPMGYSALAISSHVFRVRARDAAGNVDASPASFNWTVVTPGQAIQNLMITIGNMGMPVGVANSLRVPLGQASNLLNDPKNDVAACGKLNDFISQVNLRVRLGNLTPAQASQLLQAVNAIKAGLGC